MKFAPTTLALTSVFFPLAATAEARPASAGETPASFLAQITTDGTTSTTVTPIDTGVQIDNGDRAEGNLFHSFGEFSIPTGQEAFFNNASDIANIFSRVTGGNISNIDGLIRANGSANLFLINPAGIVFGENARLQLGGSFYGSTADSIVFGDGEFSATDLDNSPLITVNAPIGLNFRDNPSSIIYRSFSNDDILASPTFVEGTIGLIGGDINIEQANITINGGNIQIGGLSESGIVGINNDGSLDFPADVNKANVILRDGAFLNVLTEGNIEINAGNIVLDNSFIFSDIPQGSLEDSGDIVIRAQSLELLNGSIISTAVQGQGDSGNIEIDVADSLNLEGLSSIDESSSGIVTATFETGIGNAGDISIQASELFLTEGSFLFAAILGQGDAGNINVDAENIVIDGESSNGFASGIFSSVGLDALGNAGDIEITASDLTLTNGGQINANTFGQGNAGDLTINTNNLLSTSGSQISVTTFSDGNAGSLTIFATDSINISGVQPTSRGGLFANALIGSGRGGNITVITDELKVSDGATITASNVSDLGTTEAGTGEAGNLTIEASSINLENDASINAATQSGNAGNINFRIAENLTLRDNSTISAQAIGNADGGNINIDAQFIIAFPSDGNGNDILASAEEGVGGNINISAESVFNMGVRPAIPNNGTNDFDVSSEFNSEAVTEESILDKINLSQTEPLESETITTANACSVTSLDKISNFVVKGKGGIPSEPTKPFTADDLIDSNESTAEKITNPDYTSSLIQPVAYQDNGKPVYLARGIIKQADGSVILTAYPTQNNTSRTPDNYYGCS